jgi:hypothetical protein
MAAQSILPIDLSGGVDQSSSGGLGAPTVADMDHVRVQCSGDLSSAPGYAVGVIATSDAASPTVGHIVCCATTQSGGTVGLIHEGDEMYLAQLRAGNNQPRYWQRINQYETSANVPQLCGCTTRVLGSPPTTFGGDEISLCHSVQTHAGALGILAVTGNTGGLVGSNPGVPSIAEWSWLQKGVIVARGHLTWSGAPGVYGTCPIIRDGYMAAMFGSYTGTTWSGSLVVWRLSDWVTLGTVPAPVWTESVTSGALAVVYGVASPQMALSPDGDRLAVFLGTKLYVRRFSVPGTVISAALAITEASDVIWDSGSSTVWLAYQLLGSTDLTVARYSTAAVATHGPTVVATMFAGTSIAWARALGYVHLLYSGSSGYNIDGQFIAITFAETGTTTPVEEGSVDIGVPASDVLMVSTDRGYIATCTYSTGTSVLRNTYAIELRFSASAPRIVGEIAGVALEGATPARSSQMTWGPGLTPQLSSLSLATTELQEPNIGHFLEGLLLPQYLVCGASLSAIPYVSTVVAGLAFDQNLRTGCLLSWEVQTASSVGIYGKGSRSRSVMGGAMVTHGAPLWITPTGRDQPGFPDSMPAPAVGSSGGGSLVAGTYQIVTVAERVDALGLRHQSAPGYPKSITVGTNDKVSVLVPPIPGVWGRTNAGGTSTTLAASVSIYLTQENGSTFYLVRQGARPGSTVVLTTRPTGAERVLYTDTGAKARYSPPSCTCMAVGKERCLVGGVWRDTEVRFSLIMVPGEGLAWPHPSNIQWVVQLPSQVLSVAAFGDAWAVFCQTGIYIISGDGPDDNGAGGSFSQPSRVSTLQLASCRSVIEADEGIYFQADDGHMYLMQSGSAQCVRITEKIRDTFGISRLTTSGPTWQSVMGATLGGPNADLYVVQWGNPNDTGAMVGLSTVWVYSRSTGAWSRDEVSTSTTGGFLSPCSGIWPVVLPGNGDTVMWSTMNQQCFEAVSAMGPTYAPTAKVRTNWISPFGPFGDGHVSALSIIAGFPQRRERFPWKSLDDTTLTDFNVSVLRDLEDDTEQTDVLSPWPGTYNWNHSYSEPQWRTAEMNIASAKGRTLRAVITWVDTRVSLSAMALQGNGFARFERVSDARTGVQFGT